MRLTLIRNPHGDIDVHVTGCADIKRTPHHHLEEYPGEFDTVQAVVEEWFSDFLPDRGDDNPNGIPDSVTWRDYVGELNFKPCTRELQ